ncbi:MAG: hypothetical protein ABF246_04865 [Winogradskyella sp.]
MKHTFFIVLILITITIQAQDTSNTKAHYYEMPEYAEEFTAGTMAARMVDALGFRFYWASKSLREEDLSYTATEAGRTALQTISHIYDLSKIIVNSTLKKTNTRGEENVLTYLEMRNTTLSNLKIAADILRNSTDVSQFKIIFDGQEIPFWNQVNGPIADSIWHCGQLVIYRRTTGNPINPKVNHFFGTVRP